MYVVFEFIRYIVYIYECSVLGKCTFRLVHQVNHEFKHHDFECETSMGREIVQKVNNIIEMRSSPVRKDYKTLKEKKQQKKIILGL